MIPEKNGMLRSGKITISNYDKYCKIIYIASE